MGLENSHTLALRKFSRPGGFHQGIPLAKAIPALFKPRQSLTTNGLGTHIRVVSPTANPAMRRGFSPSALDVRVRVSRTCTRREPGAHWDTPGILTVSYTGLKKRGRE